MLTKSICLRSAFMLLTVIIMQFSLALQPVKARAATLAKADGSLIAQSSEDYENEYNPENTDQPEGDNYAPEETIEEVPDEGSGEGTPEVPEMPEDE